MFTFHCHCANIQQEEDALYFYLVQEVFELISNQWYYYIHHIPYHILATLYNLNYVEYVLPVQFVPLPKVRNI